MVRFRRVLVIFVIIALIAGAVAYYFIFRGLEGAVSIAGVELYVKPSDVSEFQTPIEVHVNVENRFPAGVRIEGGNLVVMLSDLKIANVAVPAQDVGRGQTTLVVNAILDNTLLDDFWYRHLSHGERSNMSIEGSIIINTFIGSLKLPLSFSNIVETRVFPIIQELNREYEMAVLGKVIVRKVMVELIKVTPYETNLKATVTIENGLRVVPLYLSGLVFNLRTCGGILLGSGEQEIPKSIVPGEVDTVVFNVTINNSKIPKLWVEHVRNREKTMINLEVWLKIEVAGRKLEIFKEHPLTASTELRTSIFKYEE